MDNIFIKPLINSEEIIKIKSALEKNSFPLAIYGLSESPKSHIAYLIHQLSSEKFLVVTSNQSQALKLYQDLQVFSQDRVMIFPNREIMFYNIDAQSNENTYQRLEVIQELCSQGRLIVVTTIDCLLAYMPPINVFRDNILDLEVGREYPLEQMIEKLIYLGYQRVDLIEGKGQFAVRGGIIDIAPSTLDQAYRVEFFDLEVDSIRRLDILTQRSFEKLDKVSIFAAKEFLLDDNSIDQGRDRVLQGLKEYSSSTNAGKKKSLLNNLSSKVQESLEKIVHQGKHDFIQGFFKFFYPNPHTFLDYFDRDSLIFIDELSRIKERAEEFDNHFNLYFSDLLNKGEVLPNQRDGVVDYTYLLKELGQLRTVVSSVFLKNDKDLRPKSIVSFAARTMQPFHGKIEMLVEELLSWKKQKYSSVILVSNKEKLDRLRIVLEKRNISTRIITSRDDLLEQGTVGIMLGSIAKGFEYPTLKLAVITDHEVYGGKAFVKGKEIKKPKDKDRIKLFSELKVGDFVVHESHGIGQYIGIEQLKVQGVKKDYIHIMYSANDKLYLPTEQVHLIQKYIGSEGKPPKLSKLGGTEWVKTKQKVKKAIKEMAIDLLKLYAIRESQRGYSFSKDGPWQAQFEDAFPYQETPDQLKSIKEIKEDMERVRPMDRLLCGDVGYGKTEVAIRAAFKAVADSKQVAVLVPTTILAQQHYNTFVQRFSDFPIKIDLLSRFRSEAEQQNTIRAVKEGNVDILIGTHRILSQDIKFKDLGLLIIDEEQRFGVTHKEKLKDIRKNIDVLTLTATPIPRTLHMSLAGIRDMSVIEDPPEERYPIQTYVSEYNDQIVRDAITREVNRKGQVYFVFNRVNGIYKVASRLKEMLPDYNIGVAHGQMNETQLEKVMMEFLQGAIDILVCTTIIETGMDISNVNTIIIHDADKLGLSQLYQLRGRVGRSNRVAYCYLTYQKDKVLTEIAEKRLKAIKEFTEFGSGFKIAMRDLEIRGAGNLLGPEQHGQMASVGYELYCKLLEETIRQLRGEDVREEIQTTIEINIDAYIPNTYIPAQNQKVEIYKKIASVSDKQEYMDIYEEIEDRFGDLPQMVINLMDISYIRALSSKAGISSINDTAEGYRMIFAEAKYADLDMIKKLIEQYPKSITLGGTSKPYILYKSKEKIKVKSVEDLKLLIEKISGLIGDKVNI